MDPVKPESPGLSLNLSYLRLEMPLRIHHQQFLHLLELQIVMRLLLEDTCSVRYACNGGLPLDNRVIA